MRREPQRIDWLYQPNQVNNTAMPGFFAEWSSCVLVSPAYENLPVIQLSYNDGAPRDFYAVKKKVLSNGAVIWMVDKDEILGWWPGGEIYPRFNQVYDQSGNGRHYVQTNQLMRPIFNPHIIDAEGFFPYVYTGYGQRTTFKDGTPLTTNDERGTHFNMASAPTINSRNVSYVAVQETLTNLGGSSPNARLFSIVGTSSASDTEFAIGSSDIAGTLGLGYRIGGAATTTGGANGELNLPMCRAALIAGLSLSVSDPERQVAAPNVNFRINKDQKKTLSGAGSGTNSSNYGPNLSAADRRASTNSVTGVSRNVYFEAFAPGPFFKTAGNTPATLPALYDNRDSIMDSLTRIFNIPLNHPAQLVCELASSVQGYSGPGNGIFMQAQRLFGNRVRIDGMARAGTAGSEMAAAAAHAATAIRAGFSQNFAILMVRGSLAQTANTAASVYAECMTQIQAWNAAMEALHPGGQGTAYKCFQLMAWIGQVATGGGNRTQTAANAEQNAFNQMLADNQNQGGSNDYAAIDTRGIVELMADNAWSTYGYAQFDDLGHSRNDGTGVAAFAQAVYNAVNPYLP